MTGERAAVGVSPSSAYVCLVPRVAERPAMLCYVTMVEEPRWLCPFLSLRLTFRHSELKCHAT